MLNLGNDDMVANSIRDWQAFHGAFIKRWAIMEDGRSMLPQLHEMKKKENELVKYFNERFDRLLRDFPHDLRPCDGAILLLYTNAFEGQFGFLLRDKPTTT